MDTVAIVLAIMSILLCIVALMLIKKMDGQKEVVIKNVEYPELNEPVQGIDYSLYRDGLGDDE